MFYRIYIYPFTYLYPCQTEFHESTSDSNINGSKVNIVLMSEEINDKHDLPIDLKEFLLDDENTYAVYISLAAMIFEHPRYYNKFMFQELSNHEIIWRIFSNIYKMVENYVRKTYDIESEARKIYEEERRRIDSSLQRTIDRYKKRNRRAWRIFPEEVEET